MQERPTGQMKHMGGGGSHEYQSEANLLARLVQIWTLTVGTN